MTFGRRGAVFLCLAAVLGARSLQAQIAGATLRGVLADPAGVPLPGVQISIKSYGTNLTYSFATDNRGRFTTADLAPGRYLMTATRSGFVSVSREVTLAIGERKTVTLRMRPGSGVEKAGPAGDSTPTAVVADKTTVSELPSNGRDWTQAATLQAGVAAVKTQQDAGDPNSGRGQRGFGAQLSVSGARPQQNNYILNGITINDYANSAPGSVLGLDLGADAVEQFSVMTSSYPADFGRSSGGIVNAITRAGSNQFHGSAYEFLRNSALDARNFFDGAIPPFRRNQFGAVVGGPIRKDRTFFFLNYEELRQSLGVTHVDSVPSPAARQGILSTGNVTVDPQAGRYLAFFPLPNRGLLGVGDTGVFAFSGQQVTPETYVNTRVDHKFNDRDSLSGSWVVDTAQTTQPDAFNVRINAIETHRNVFSLQERHVLNPQSVNFLRLGVNRVVASIGETPTALNPLAADTSFGFFPVRTAGIINVLGLTNFTGGLGAASPYAFHWTSFQFYDDFTRTEGTRSLRFGIGIERMRDNMFGVTNPNGSFTFTSLGNFLTNRPFSLDVPLPGAVNPRGLRQTVIAAYVQQDWRIASTLNLNLGARYETATVPVEVANRLSTLRGLSDPVPHLGNPYFSNPTRANFEPRVGLAWDPFRNGRISVRAGFGIFDVLPLPYEFELLSLFASPFFLAGTPNSLPQGSFPSDAIRLAQTSSNLFRAVYIEPHPARNYVNQWNLNLEARLPGSSSLLLGYVGSRGIHQPFRVDDANLVLPAPSPSGYIWPNPVGFGTKINPSYGRVNALFWDGDSYYEGLQVQAKAGVGSRLQILASFTWGKSIDTGSSTIAGDQFANSVSSLPWYDLRRNRGPSDFNIGKSFSAHVTYELSSAGANLGRWYLKHWRLNGTFKVSDGSPFTVVIGGDRLGTKSTDPFDVPNAVSGAECSTPVNHGGVRNYLKLQCFAFPATTTLLGNLGRNSVLGPGLENVDASLFKDNFIKRVSETFNVQLRLEVFNVANHANFAPPLNHRTIFDQSGNLVSGAGLIDSTTTPSRQMQIGLKVIW